MRTADIRHGAEFWMLPIVLMTWVLPVNLVLVFLLSDPEVAFMFLEMGLAMFLGFIVSFFPGTKRFLNRRYTNPFVSKMPKLVFWDYVYYYVIILGTILHPGIFLLFRLALIGVWNE